MSYEAYQWSLPKYEVQTAYRSYLNFENKQRDSIIFALKFIGGQDIKIEDYYVVCRRDSEKEYKGKRDAVGVRLVLLNAADADIANELRDVRALKDTDIGTCRFNQKHPIKVLAYTLEYRVIVSDATYQQLLTDINNNNLPSLVELRCDELDKHHKLEEGAVVSVDWLSFTTQYFSTLEITKAQAAYIKNPVIIGFGVMMLILAIFQYLN